MVQATTASTPPARRGDISPSIRRIPSRPITPQPGLSTSEPSLRFPRPQGSKDLAHWISTSNPDIMKMHTTTEDTGLSESTYELISATDTESQDENYTSISESVGSLDFHRPDDVHSLAGTEHTNDDESVVDDTDAHQLAQLHVNPVFDAEGRRDTLVALDLNQDESESDEEARSRSSLEYTQHSLGTPSILTPEASKIVERPHDKKWFAGTINTGFSRFWEEERRVRDYVIEVGSAAIPGLVFACLASLLLSVVYTSTSVNDFSPQTTTSAATITATTATTVPVLSSSTKPHSSLHTSPASTGGVGLIPVDDTSSEEWLFGTRKPTVSFAPRDQGDILVHVAQRVQRNWLSKGCLKITATRGNQEVDTIMSSVPEGILLKFPKRETHGVVILSLKATCRPRIERMVKVHFSKGIMEEAFEMTKHLAHDLSDLVPAAAQEAERRLEGAKQSLESVSHVLVDKLQSASHQLCMSMNAAGLPICEPLGVVVTDAVAHINRAMDTAERFRDRVDSITWEDLDVQNLQHYVQMRLLEAQISAKVWWLKEMGHSEEHVDYERKAKDFVAERQAANRAARQARRPEQLKPTSRPWSNIMWLSRCKSKTAGRRRGVTHACQAEA